MAMKLLEKVKKRAEKAESILLDKEPNIKLNGKFSVNMLNTKAKDPTDAILELSLMAQLLIFASAKCHTCWLQERQDQGNQYY